MVEETNLVLEAQTGTNKHKCWHNLNIEILPVNPFFVFVAPV